MTQRRAANLANHFTQKFQVISCCHRFAITIGVLVASLFFGTSRVHGSEISYVYDDLGRLRAVIDPNSDAAVYNYDSVGNLLSISSQSSSVISIIDFTPKQGPVGTTVTIHGTGFSTTPTENTVAFNGVAATVISANTNQIVATVPMGASTGPIGVTTLAGSVTSSSNFMVVEDSYAVGPPTITSFAPNIGTAGTAVTITGTNFDTNSNNNKVRFNPALAAVSSAASTSIATSVPLGARSGPISVSTRGGTAVSAEDFFVPPSPYTAADVAFTGRLVAGGPSLTVTINTANKIGLVTFRGTVGDYLSLGITNVTQGYGCCFSPITIYKPDGSVLASSPNVGNTGAEIDFPVLPVTGTYVVLIDPNGTNTGSLTLTLSSPITGTLVVDGPSLPLSLSRVGQDARINFSGNAGGYLNLGVSNMTIGSDCCVLNITVYKPDGSTFISTTTVGGSGAEFDFPVLPATGTYLVIVDPIGVRTGNVTLTLSSPVTGTLSSSLPISLTRPAQDGRITFIGQTGQSLTLGLTNVTQGYGCCFGAITVYKPDGGTLVSSTNVGSAGAAIPLPTLPADGNYLVLVDPYGTNMGSLTLSLTSP